MDVDPADSVRALLENSESPMSTQELTQALADRHSEHQVTEALDFWRREHHAAAQDEAGKWSWQGTSLD